MALLKTFNLRLRFRTVNDVHKLDFNVRSQSKWSPLGLRNIDEVIPKNVMKGVSPVDQPNGHKYDLKPFKLVLQAGKRYAWCLCGHSKSQPLCDGTHRIDELGIKLKPLFFQVAETKEYWLCNCKQTLHRPFCDGTHLPLQEEARIKRKKREEERMQRT